MKRSTTKRTLKLKRDTITKLDKLDGVNGGGHIPDGYGFSLNRNNCGGGPI